MRKTIKTYDAAFIAAIIKSNFERNNIYTLTAVISEGCAGGYEVAIADKDEGGYTATGLIIDTPRFDDACHIIDAANKILFPERSKKENAMIQLSTMRLSEIPKHPIYK